MRPLVMVGTPLRGWSPLAWVSLELFSCSVIQFRYARLRAIGITCLRRAFLACGQPLREGEGTLPQPSPGGEGEGGNPLEKGDKRTEHERDLAGVRHLRRRNGMRAIVITFLQQGDGLSRPAASPSERGNLPDAEDKERKKVGTCGFGGFFQIVGFQRDTIWTIEKSRDMAFWKGPDLLTNVFSIYFCIDGEGTDSPRPPLEGEEVAGQARDEVHGAEVPGQGLNPWLGSGHPYGVGLRRRGFG